MLSVRSCDIYPAFQMHPWTNQCVRQGSDENLSYTYHCSSRVNFLLGDKIKILMVVLVTEHA
jgi:hypothetical protein